MVYGPLTSIQQYLLGNVSSQTIQEPRRNPPQSAAYIACNSLQPVKGIFLTNIAKLVPLWKMTASQFVLITLQTEKASSGWVQIN